MNKLSNKKICKNSHEKDSNVYEYLQKYFSYSKFKSNLQEAAINEILKGNFVTWIAWHCKIINHKCCLEKYFIIMLCSGIV